MSLPSSIRYKALKREKARARAKEAALKEENQRKKELDRQAKEAEVQNPVGPIVENPTGSYVIDPAGDYLANAKGSIVENPMGPYVANPSDQLGKGLPPMEQEDYNILMKKMGDAVNSTAVQSKNIDMPMYDAEAKDYYSPTGEAPSDYESLPASDEQMSDQF